MGHQINRPEWSYEQCKQHWDAILDVVVRLADGDSLKYGYATAENYLDNAEVGKPLPAEWGETQEMTWSVVWDGQQRAMSERWCVGSNVLDKGGVVRKLPEYEEDEEGNNNWEALIGR